jgi:hypothetical protein
MSKDDEEKAGFDISSETLVPSNESGNGVEDIKPEDQFMVWWDEPAEQDATNPMNWPSAKKWTNILTISAISFLV